MKTVWTPNKPHALGSSAIASRMAVKTAKILLAGRLTARSSPDGVQRQMLGLAGALAELGLAARPWRPWEDDLADADCLHLFGAGDEFLTVVESAARQRLPVVLSPLASLDPADDWLDPQPLAQKVSALAGYVGRSVCPRWPSRRRHLYQAVDLLLPNSHVEARQIMRRYQVPAERIRVVPHGVDARLARAEAEPFLRRYGARDFVLYVGPIEPRHHQLGFLWAMSREERAVVILGDAVPGSEWYLDECRRIAGPHVQFVPQLDEADPLLASAYAACGCLVAAGGPDAPERIALAAGMSGTPLVLFEGGSGGEYFGHQAVYIRPDDVAGIRRGVLAALARKRSQSLAEHVQTYFSWQAIAAITREAYRTVLRRRP